MRICMISEAVSTHTQRIAESIASCDGVDLHLVSSYYADIKGIKMHQMPIYDRNPIRQISNIRRIRQLFREIDPDLYHLFGLFSVSSLGSMMLVNGLSPLVVSVWGSDIVSGTQDSFKSRKIRKYILSKAELIISISEYLAEETRKYVTSDKNIAIIPWPISEFYPPAKERTENGTIYIGFAKKLYNLSGPDILLRSFTIAKSMSKNNIILKIAGEGELEKDLKAMAGALHISDSVEWLGKIDGKGNMRNFYNSIDILVMPSRRESFGMSAAEASATGLPVIASRVGGLPEVVEQGVNGILVETENVQELAKAICSLADNPRLRKQMGHNSAEIAKKKYSHEATVGKLINAYRQTLASQHPT